MNRATKLGVAAIVAPYVRDQAFASRCVTVLNKDGVVVGQRSLAQVAAAVLAAHDIEIQVDDGVVPDERKCRCGRYFATEKSRASVLRCPDCESAATCPDCGKVCQQSRLRSGGRKRARQYQCRACQLRVGKRCRDCGHVMPLCKSGRCLPCAARRIGITAEERANWLTTVSASLATPG
jgi:hypothetical protein